jgi:hypothetical protein
MHNFGRYPRREIAMSYTVPAASIERIGSRFIRAIEPLFRTLERFQTIALSTRRKTSVFGQIFNGLARHI